MYPKPQEYLVSPSVSPPSSPPSPADSPFPPLTYTNHPVSEPSAKTPAGGPWVVKPWTTTPAPQPQPQQPPPPMCILMQTLLLIQSLVFYCFLKWMTLKLTLHALVCNRIGGGEIRVK